MHIVIKFLTTSKFYITSKNQRPVTSPSGKVGGARFMVITLSKCKKKLRLPPNAERRIKLGVELFQVFMDTRLWQDGEDQQVFHCLFIPHLYVFCSSSLNTHFYIRDLHTPVPVRRRFRLDQVGHASLEPAMT